MLHLISPLVNQTFSGLLKQSRATIFPFTEVPATTRVDEAEKASHEPVSAFNLFSLFTADIIKEEAVFVR